MSTDGGYINSADEKDVMIMKITSTTLAVVSGRFRRSKEGIILRGP